MASPDRPILPRLEAKESPRQPPALTDDLLEGIFLRVASPADLARASTACVSFRRLIADPTFLRRYRSLHPPLLLGFLERTPGRFLPAQAPHPNAPVARAYYGLLLRDLLLLRSRGPCYAYGCFYWKVCSTNKLSIGWISPLLTSRRTMINGMFSLWRQDWDD
ncbi:hypothetical protein ACP70R_005651 [Stipagrostis hirtigluma subsp. patula]